MLIRFLRLRPFLWPLPVVIALFIAAFWFENGIIYDDGGLGSVVFLAILILGFAGILVSELITMTVGPLYHDSGPVAAILGVVIVLSACLPYLIADRLAMRWLASRQGK